jgi:predicted ribosome quality control (RQC) complex YloA/Tae2 family protein
MSLSAADIAALVREIGPALTGGWIQKIHQPLAPTITLDVRARGKTLTLLMSADPSAPRLHFATGRRANPPHPPAFCQFLRAHIQGARIDAIEQIGEDRLVRVALTTREGPRALIAALTGSSADLLVVDEQDHILMSLQRGRAAAGSVFTPPSPRPGSRPTSERTAPPSGDGDFPVSAWVERECAGREESRAADQWRTARLAQLGKALKKLRRRIEALQADLTQAQRYRDYARYGELLKANLDTVRKGAADITVVDYFDPALPELSLPLDPAKTPQGNMEEYFRKHRKFVGAERTIVPRLAEAEAEIARLTEERAAVQSGRVPGTISAAEMVPGTSPPSPVRRSVPGTLPRRSGPFRRFTSADGLPIFVGRNARENDELSFGMARGDDIWLHAHGTPGSHVLIRLEKGAEPPPETLRDAAVLALLYSDLKKAGKGEVIYTRGKYVKRVKGRSLGTVTVTREKSLYVTLDRPRLDRLKREAG